ncbi:MAG: hypothetical protein ACI9IA_000682 [Enterobacterales bacterium]|jgi:hypothetical protein
MLNIEKTTLPADALLNIYNINGYHTDCYTTDINLEISFEQFVKAFYSSPLFRLERLILKWAVAKPSTDIDIDELLNANSNEFAAWSVEKREDNQLLMCDFQKRTRSWFKVSSNNSSNTFITHLYFGSAVVPKQNNVSKTTNTHLGFLFTALLGFHKLYSILLLLSAKKRLLSSVQVSKAL